MEISQVIGEKIQELQILERNLQSSSMEKQNLQVELNEIDNAADEIKKAPSEVYRILSGLMIKTNADSLTKDLNERKKVLDLRILAIVKQEKLVEEKANSLREQINYSFSTKK